MHDAVWLFSSICSFLGSEEHGTVKKYIPFCLGLLSCFYGSSSVVGDDCPYKCECKLFLDVDNEKWTVEYLQHGFWCSRCDRSIPHNLEGSTKIVCLPETESSVGLNCDFNDILSLFFKLLFDDSLEDVQVACVRIIRRMLLHGTSDVLFKRRSEWIKCIELLLISKKKAVREVFCSQISSFIEEPVFSCLFLDEDSSHKPREQNILEIIQRALVVAEDPQIIGSLLESTAQITSVVDIHSRIFYNSLILLVDQLDNPQLTVRMCASRLIRKSCFFHLKGGLELMLSKAVLVQNELFDYITACLASRPKMVREFAEAIFGIQIEELVRRMIPVVLPKLVVSWQDNNVAVPTLYELAKYVDTDMVPLVVHWLPKVLSFALHRADKLELVSTLQFYHDHTGSNNQEIFAAALPALLDELVCFVDCSDAAEIRQRYKTLAPCLQ